MRFLHRQEVDELRWNAVIRDSPAGFPYAYTAILDTCTGGRWNAIVADDYSFVLPLPYNRKLFGFKQFYQPYFLQQLGCFGRSPDDREIENIFSLIRRKSIRSLISFQEENTPWLHSRGRQRTNYILDLGSGYDVISESYKKNLRQRVTGQLRQAGNLEENISLTSFLQHYFRLTYVRFAHSEKISPEYVQDCFSSFQQLGFARNIILRNGDGEIYAGLLYLLTKTRIIIALQFNDPAFRSRSGPTFLIDALIRKYAGSGRTLDFEGSEIPGVAAFYRAFNPVSRPFVLVKTP